MRIELTPIADAPVRIGSHALITDNQGAFSIEVLPEERADISSGLLAIGFGSIAGIAGETLSGTGAEIASIAAGVGGAIVIEADQRVKPEALCYIRDANTGVGSIRFPFTNRYGVTLSVESDKLNSLTSVADPSKGPDREPYPLADFESIDTDRPDGYLGFEWPVNYFIWFDPARNSDIISAEWKLINRTVSLDQPLSEVPLCPSAARLDSCSAYTADLSNRIYAQMFSSVTRLSQIAEKAARKGIWKNRSGKFRNPYLDQAARSLRTTKFILNRLAKPAFICPAGLPNTCRMQEFPKTAILYQFDSILKVKLPKQLKFLIKSLGKERQKFLVELRKQPDSIVVCDQ